jgi:argininosuccinate lyase
MPQKRNPVAIEHVRAIGSKALGQAVAILTSVHNTPFGDVVDTEDDLQPLVFSMFRDAMRAVKLTAATMATAEFDAKRLEAGAGEGWTTLTELADTIVREHQVPFRAAHAIAARLVERCAREPDRPVSELIAEISRELLGEPIVFSEAALANTLSPRHFVDVRRTPGGPAPEQTRLAADTARERLEEDCSWWQRATDALTAAHRELENRSARL